MRPQTTSIILLLCFYSCTNTGFDNTALKEKIDTDRVSIDTAKISKHLKIDPAKVFRAYAVKYKPFATDSNPNINLPELNDILKFAIDSLLQTDTANLKIWTALILEKQFLHHLRCCNQSYEIRNGFDKLQNLDKENNPILYAFLQVTNQLEIGKSKNEFLNSGFIHNYLIEHNGLAFNRLIKPYFDKIDKIEKWAEAQNENNEARNKNDH